jgi:hypothetical protein
VGAASTGFGDGRTAVGARGFGLSSDLVLGNVSKHECSQGERHADWKPVVGMLLLA